MFRQVAFVSLVCFGLAGCDVFESPKTEIEQQYLAQHPQLRQAIDAIRTQGVDAVAKTAEQGSVAACVAENLANDPLGSLATVEGALQESANLTDLLASINELTSQEITLEQIPDLLRQGADTLNYVRTLLQEYELVELKTQAQLLVQNTQQKSADIGSHLRQVIGQCEQP
ncbi:lipoprotein, putative [Pseudoalteromonas luteoviolacea B = ATCC 29581]|nr:lipoprotein, putative [Pseudoalteromonas luteoviolacea B = ATCC 29581]